MLKSLLQNATSRGVKIVKNTYAALGKTGRKMAALILAGGTVTALTNVAHASTSGSTTPSTAAVQYSTFYSMYDVLNSILNILYPVVVPILVAGSAIFVAWWAWHRLKGAVS
jgi:hypothetical protein